MVHSASGLRSAKTLLAIVAFAALGGCEAAGPGPGGDPGASALPPGETCGSIREQLTKLDRKGVQAYVEAQNAGKKLQPSQKADADNYNRLLGEYLGSRCHV